MTASLKWESTADDSQTSNLRNKGCQMRQRYDIDKSTSYLPVTNVVMPKFLFFLITFPHCHIFNVTTSHTYLFVPKSGTFHSASSISTIMRMLRYTEHSPHLHIINIFIKLSFFHELITYSLPASSVSPWECWVTINTLLCLIFEQIQFYTFVHTNLQLIFPIITHDVQNLLHHTIIVSSWECWVTIQ
jgi:hypothetical protein